MENRTFPGWAGPLVGAVVGVGLGITQGIEAGFGVAAPWLILWGAAGTAAGSIVWLVDASRRRQAQHQDRPPPRRQPLIESAVVRFGLWFWILLLLVTGIVVGYIGVEQFLRANQVRQWPTTTATVFDSHVKTSAYTHAGITTQSFTPVVRYRYTVSGQELEGQTIDQSPLDVCYSERAKADGIVARYPAGSTPSVYHDPADPARTMLDPGIPWSEAVLFVVVPLGALGLAVLVIFVLRAEKDETVAN